MYKHVCLLRQKNDPTGIWHYELDSMVAYNNEQALSAPVFARLMDAPWPSELEEIAQDISAMRLRMRFNNDIKGFTVFDAPVMLSMEEMASIVRDMPVSEIKFINV